MGFLRALRFLTSAWVAASMTVAPLHIKNQPLAETSASSTQIKCNDLFSSSTTHLQEFLSFNPIPMPEKDPQYKKLLEMLSDTNFVQKINGINHPRTWTNGDVAKFVLLAKLTAHLYLKGKILEKLAEDCKSIVSSINNPPVNSGTRTQTDYEAVCNRLQEASILYLTAAGSADPTLVPDLTKSVASVGSGTVAVISTTCLPNIACDAAIITFTGLSIIIGGSPTKADLWRKLFNDELALLWYYKDSVGVEFEEKIIGILTEQKIANTIASKINKKVPQGISITDIALDYILDEVKDALTDIWGEKILEELKSRLTYKLAQLRKDAYQIPGLPYGYICNQALSDSEVKKDATGTAAKKYLDQRNAILISHPYVGIFINGIPSFKTVNIAGINHDPYLNYCPAVTDIDAIKQNKRENVFLAYFKALTIYLKDKNYDERDILEKKFTDLLSYALHLTLRGRKNEARDMLGKIDKEVVGLFEQVLLPYSLEEGEENAKERLGNIFYQGLGPYSFSQATLLDVLKGKKKEARAKLEILLEPTPQSSFTHTFDIAMLALIYLELGDVSRALQIKQEIEEKKQTNEGFYTIFQGKVWLFKDPPSIIDNMFMVILHARLGEHEKAKKVFKITVKAYRKLGRPYDLPIDGHPLVAVASHMVGNKERAAAILKRSDRSIFREGIHINEEKRRLYSEMLFYQQLAHLYIDRF